MTKLEDILKIENDITILSFKDSENNCLIWPLIRNEFIRTIIGDLFYQENILIPPKASFPHSHITIIKAILNNITKINRLKGEIIIHSSGSHVMTESGYINRLTEYFGNVDKYKSVTLESISPVDWHWPFPRPNTDVLFDTDILAYCRIKSIKHKPKQMKEASEMLDFLENQTRIVLNYELSKEKKEYLTSFLARQISSITPKRKYYDFLFRRLGTRLLLKEEACYGHSSIENQVAHENNITVAEFQHGSISAGHDSYNFSDSICKSSEYAKVLPDYLLSFGAFWSSQINAPIKHVYIGNPHRTQKLKKINRLKKKTDILVLGDGIETNKYLSLCEKLAKYFLDKNYRIIFRPHPLERTKFVDKQKINNVYIEYECDLYQAFESAKVLISEVSTGLFESIGIVDRIILWKTEKTDFYYPYSLPFDSFYNIDELLANILLIDEDENDFGKTPSASINDIWANNWEENYVKFLNEVLSK